MLQFTSLSVEDIGPFKGNQTIDFTSAGGVTIIWGINGRGKTTLLNIFRYAIYGKFLNRQGTTVDLTLLSNSEARADGRFGFKVVLRMSIDDNKYELTRQYKPRAGVSRPTRNDDYEQVVFLKENGAILSSAASEHILKSIMPEQVSRFFLFDGELLQEYEELLLDETDAGTIIKDSIEKILGVPVLTNGAVDVMTVYESYKSAKAKAAQNNDRTTKLATQISALEAELQEHRTEFDRLREQLTQEITKRNSLEVELAQNERVQKLLADAKALEISIEEKKARRDALLVQICVITKEAWRGLASTRVSAVLSLLSEQTKQLEEKERAQHTAEHFLKDMRIALTKKHCQLCDQDISDVILEKMGARITAAENEYGGLSEGEVNTLRLLRKRKTILEGMVFPSCKDKLEVYEEQLSQVNVEIVQDERKFKTVRDDLERYGDIEGLSESTQQRLRQHSQCLAKIDNLEEGKQKEKDIINETQSSLTTLYGRLDRMAGGSDMENAKLRSERCEQISAIFEKGISAYRDKLKTDVERDATELFLRISNDPDYVKLEINDNYGLSIVHSSGTKVPLRSSGFEHVVALSLIGALHKNAPLRGPIIMDSIGRLDPIHKRGITTALPTMSDQIILLLYPQEIDEQMARETLGAALKKEYQLTRQTSFYTRIDPQVD